MAAIAQPTWAEVQFLDSLVLEAINIVKGEMNGDKFLWEKEYRDPKTGITMIGVWKSVLDEEKESQAR